MADGDSSAIKGITSTEMNSKQGQDVYIIGGGSGGDVIVNLPPSGIITPTITVDTAVYAIGDVIGGKLTLTDAMRISGGSGILQSIYVADKSGTQKPDITILIFDSDPTVATLVDQGAFAFGADISKNIRKIKISTSDYDTIGGVCVADKVVGEVVKAVGSKNLYAVVVANGAPDFVAATDLIIRFDILRD